MIISKTNKFAFIKGRKVAGTSIEVGLSRLCYEDDILTPITPIDELLRLKTTGRSAQNYGADSKRLERYRKTIITSEQSESLNWSNIRKPRGLYTGHMSFTEMEKTFGGFNNDWTIIAITRCPYTQALSRIKHWANKRAIQQGTKQSLDPNSHIFQQAKARFLGRASERSIKTNISLYKDAEQQLRPNFYLRFEYLNDDYDILMKKLGESSFSRLPHLKQTTTLKSYMPEEIFKDDEIRIINSCFAEEFEKFGYNQL